ncbi:protein kinase [Streptomyces sp. NPDC059989]|uniref:protein kinase domain-containing protein n=1 Tax=Streptomyces sp. NPDC059989 TaxID=3347026 RepID=UPI00369ED19F
MQTGDVLADRYRLDRRLGHGGMGEVWLGHDLKLDRSVAVKGLLDTATHHEVVARFRREATIGARLQHPGITVVHDVGQHDGRLFIVMELLAGEDLRSLLARERGGLPVDTALGLTAQAAEALAAAHEQNVVHRDLKPANLFLLPGGRVKICDFGIARSSDATLGLTPPGEPFGSPAFMAPEQVRGESVDARSDLYALGCVLYALLSGQPPFGTAGPAYVLMHRHLMEAPRPLGVSPGLNRLVLALLAKDPADRPESAELVAKALRGLVGAGHAAPGAGAAGAVTSDAADTDTAAHAGARSVATPEVPQSYEAFLRELVLEAVETAGAVPDHGESRTEALAVAADAAARFDAGLARRLLADAELCAWKDGEGAGARVAEHLTLLARETSTHAPARTERVLTDAVQALFTVSPRRHREQPLRWVVQELAWVAPERAAQLAPRLFAGREQAEGDRVWARIVLTTARTDLGLAERYLDRIADAGRRAVTEAEIAGVIAAEDPAAGLRRAERIHHADAHALALLLVAQAHEDVIDAEESERAFVRAEQTLTWTQTQKRAAVLRETAAGLAERGQPMEAERLRKQAENVRTLGLERSGDSEIDAVTAALAGAGRRITRRGMWPFLDLATARERAAAVRATRATGSERAYALARIARQCAEGRPWLPELRTDPGIAPDHPWVTAPGAAARTNSRRRWKTEVTPTSLRLAGDGVAWAAGDEVGSVRADDGAHRWTAAGDAGVPVPPPAGPTSVACAADAERRAVFVAVERREGPGVRLLAREPLDGRVRWWRDLPGETATDAPDPARFTVAGGLVLYAGRQAVTALDAATGEEAWRRPGPYGDAPAMTPGPDCLVLADRERLTGLHLRTGALLWPRGGADHAAPRLPVGPVHVLDGSVLRALHQGTGLPLWSVELGVPAPGVLTVDGVVYAAGADPRTRANSVVALHAESGRELWRRQVTGKVDSPDCVLELLGTRAGLLYVKSAVGDSGVFVARSGPPFLIALYLDTGSLRWYWSRRGISRCSALLYGNRVVLARPELASITVP